MDKKFWLLTLEKIVEICISVKVLIIAASLSISTWLIIHSLISGDAWCAFNGGIISTIVGLREAFKVSKVRSTDDSENLKP